MQKIFILLLFAVIISFSPSSCVYALVCPDIASIKNGKLHGWHAINNLDDEEATVHEIVEFERTVQHFSGAEWSKDYLFGPGRCNYESDIEVSLASYTIPIEKRPQGPHWSWDGIVAHCDSPSIFDCYFQPSLAYKGQ